MIYLLTKESTLWAFEGPEEPKKIHCMGKGFCCDGRRCDSLQSKDDHEEAMSTARESALPVVNAEEIINTQTWPDGHPTGIRYFHYPDQVGMAYIMPGETVALPGWALEKVYQFEASELMQRIGHPKWAALQEPQEKNYHYFKNKGDSVREAYRLKRSEPVCKVCGGKKEVTGLDCDGHELTCECIACKVPEVKKEPIKLTEGSDCGGDNIIVNPVVEPSESQEELLNELSLLILYNTTDKEILEKFTITRK